MAENDNDVELGTIVGVAKGEFLFSYFVSQVYVFRYPPLSWHSRFSIQHTQRGHAQSKDRVAHHVADVNCLSTEGPSFSYHFNPSFGEQTKWSFGDQIADVWIGA